MPAKSPEPKGIVQAVMDIFTTTTTTTPHPCYEKMCKQGIKTKADYFKFLRSHLPDRTGKQLTGAELDMYNDIIKCSKDNKFCNK